MYYYYSFYSSTCISILLFFEFLISSFNVCIFTDYVKEIKGFIIIIIIIIITTIIITIIFYITTKSMRALWLINQLWVIVPVNPRKNRASSELIY